MTRPRVLLVGPLPIQGDVLGGTKVSFRGMAEALSEGDALEIEVLNTSRRLAHRSGAGRLLANVCALARVLFHLVRRAPRVEAVLWSVSAGGAVLSGPLVWLACRLRRRPLAVRLFGGDLDRSYARAGAALRWLARATFLRSPLLLLQTHALCARFADLQGVRWLPTNRGLQPPQREPSAEGGARHFLFVGQLRPEKGVAEALAASDTLPPDAELLLYGPTMPGLEAGIFDGHARARWSGALPSERVPEALVQGDVLVFPSYHPGEGIPGIVVEALQCGVPVIATRWRSLPEIVVDGVNGLVVEKQDADGLAQAMRRLYEDADLHQRLRAGARESGRAWQSSDWNGRLEDWLFELCTTRKVA